MKGKRVFISLLGLSILFFIGLIYYTWKVVFTQNFAYRAVFLVILAFFLLLLALISIGSISLVFSLLKGKNYGIFQRLVLWEINLLFPFIVQIGKLFQITQDRIQKSFIEVNNKLVEAKKIKVRPQKLLLLLPHCLQNDQCSFKITGTVANCHHCGRCNIGSLVDLAREYKVNIRVVTGGTLARKAVLDAKPEAVIAVACERDLSSGIIDASPLPVFGILNDRPFGPCTNTRVNLEKVEQTINKFLRGE
ncbi:MAG TPA: DUF116 domain-containing protein [Firmicutes bacterium]|nr:DUF116 domain-containing protein [Bacillota bacterium]